MPISCPAPAPCLPPPSWRGACAAAALAAALLAGCAGQAGREQANASGNSLDPLYADDPIGALLARNHSPRRTAARKLVPEDVPAQSEAITPVPLADTALELLGIRYRWGGIDPATGFDCSGLVAYAAQQSLGLQLPRRADEIARLGTSIKRNDLQAGDLVFFNTMGRRYSHVGIYLGEQRFVHAPSSGGVVRIERMDMHYWAKRYNGARRLVASR